MVLLRGHGVEEIHRFFVGLTTEPLDAQTLLKGQFGDVWIIWYYFLYPGHEEFLRRCEAFFDTKSDGDYEGDWNAIGVLVKRPGTLPWETPTPTFPTPSRVGYGIRLRGLAKEVSPTMFQQAMTIHDWDTEVEKKRPASKGLHRPWLPQQLRHRGNATAHGSDIRIHCDRKHRLRRWRGLECLGGCGQRRGSGP